MRFRPRAGHFPPEAGDAERWRYRPAAERGFRLSGPAGAVVLAARVHVSKYLDSVEIWIFDEANFCSAPLLRRVVSERNIPVALGHIDVGQRPDHRWGFSRTHNRWKIVGRLEIGRQVQDVASDSDVVLGFAHEDSFGVWSSAPEGQLFSSLAFWACTAAAGQNQPSEPTCVTVAVVPLLRGTEA
jgi:hypothetical protein